MAKHEPISPSEAADRLAIGDALAPVFADLNQYAATMYFVFAERRLYVDRIDDRALS